MDNKTQHLFELLENAAAEMISYRDKPTFSYFDTCEEVGLYIQDCLIRAKEGDLKELSNLWYVFAPTGVWDDSGGSQEIANKIFEIINDRYPPENL